MVVVPLGLLERDVRQCAGAGEVLLAQRRPVERVLRIVNEGDLAGEAPGPQGCGGADAADPGTDDDHLLRNAHAL